MQAKGLGSAPGGVPRSAARRFTTWVAPAVRPWRLMLAGKTAVAATTAWFLGSLLPGELGDFSYYAPLGALVSLTPTLMDSVRSSVQTLIGLGVGIGLAWALIVSPLPGWASVALAIGLGTLLAGLPGLGQGRDYVPIAALFVIIIGGADANDFSIGYLVQMALGVGVGLLVNVLIMPPLYVRESTAGIAAARGRMADALRAMAGALRSDSPRESDDPPAWEPAASEIRRDLDAARDRVRDAKESRRANPRARWNRHDMRTDEGQLEMLQQMAPPVLEIGDSLRAALWGLPVAVELPDNAVGALADAIEAAADLIAAEDEQQRGEALAGSDRTLRGLRRVIRDGDSAGADAGEPEPGDDPASESILFALRRIHAEVASVQEAQTS
ncbi:FUSC family protein [Plantibacter flavus]|uniref:FUSC family protein n=1 Tax=Plantibacter flavus TaxID=150123 RepID=UPI003F154431